MFNLDNLWIKKLRKQLAYLAYLACHGVQRKPEAVAVVKKRNKTEGNEGNTMKTSNQTRIGLALCVALMAVTFGSTMYANNAESWQKRMMAARTKTALGRDIEKVAKPIYDAMRLEYPIETDWFSQGSGKYELTRDSIPYNLIEYLKPKRDNSFEQSLISRVITTSGEVGKKFNKELGKLKTANIPAGDKQWLNLFVKACGERRAARLKNLSKEVPVIAFVKRHPVKPSFYAYTEGQSDAQRERHFNPDAKLCLLKIDGSGCSVEDLLGDPKGVIRDLDVSYDGKRLLFAWKKSDRQDDYHLYEMDIVTKKIRQLTSGLGVADYEGVYLPDGDIMFSSSRCVQIVDCWWTEVSNMYKCDKDGKYLRRLGFDQVHTVHPAVMNNGSVVYTRWDYNDRGQVFPQPLFQMNQDGTRQTEYYGNNSWFPTVTDHARAIPNSDKLVTVLHGHHTWQAGELAIIDCTKGTQEAAGVQLIAPVRETGAVRVDGYGQRRELFRHPYALSETEFIVSMSPDCKERNRDPSQFALYWIHADGNRELLVFDPEISCNNPMAVKPRKKPHIKPSLVDYKKDSGIYYMQDIYVGPGLKGVERGTIKELRVVALEFRAAGVGSNSNGGEAGGAMVSTPISIGNGSWDVKKILGAAKVYPDGSAMFKVPANTPVYFQAVDDRGQVVQTMRSWSTLMPGEVFGCVGCHEDKFSAPLVNKVTLASKAVVQELKPFYGPACGFSFNKEVQPILDKNCISCHKADSAGGVMNIKMYDAVIARGSRWKYTLQKPDNRWYGSSFNDSTWKTGQGGFGTKEMPGADVKTTWRTKEIWLRSEFDFSADTKTGLMLYIHHGGEMLVYINGILATRERGFMTAYDGTWIRPHALEAIQKGKNSIAVYCKNTSGPYYVDVGVYNKKSVKDVNTIANGNGKMAFSLKGDPFGGLGGGRAWSTSYLTLTGILGTGEKLRKQGRDNIPVLNWISAQSRPTMLPPYHRGSAVSGMIKMLREGHGKVKLSCEEMDKLCAWIDLAVPFCGDYIEANNWSESQKKYYLSYQRKRERLATEVRRNTEALIKHETGM